ncbi:ParB/RepB/Spo0J family partition protein [Elusimicrobiota bacterium]
MKRKALGRGLAQLIPQAPESESSDGQRAEVRRVPIGSIRPNHLQPRKNFDPERLSELSQSIKEHGLAQPIVVSFDSISNSYEVIAGERRLRASQLAGFKHIDVIIRTPKSDQDRLAVALVENIQRDGLNAIEAAVAYKRLMDEFGVSQTGLSQLLGKSKSTISNTLRLLDLPDRIQKAVQFEQLTEGHARALLMVHDAVERDKLFRLAIDQHLSVRNVEKMAQQIEGGDSLPEEGKKKGAASRPLKSANVMAMEKEIEKRLGTRVEIRTKPDEKSGRVIIHFYSLEEFDGILKVLQK